MNNNNNIVGYDPETGQPIYKPLKKSGFKNFLIYELFNFIFSIIVPLVLLFLNMAIMRSEKASTVELIIILVQAIALLLFKEVLICKTAKSAAKSTYLMGKFVFVLNLIDILLATLILFNNGFALNVGYIIYIVFVVSRIISYILVKLLVLKEKIEYKKYLIIGAVSYIALFTFLYYATNPTGINKMLFNVFGSNEFSSKELKIEIVDYYNKNEYRDDVNYTHKFTTEELEQIDYLEINYNITTDDLSLLPNVKFLELNNCNYENLDFSKNNSLIWVKIKNSKIKNLNTLNLIGTSKIEISESEIENLIINEGRIESIYVEKSKINELKVSGENIKEVEITETPISNMEIEDTTNLNDLSIKKSTVNNVVLDNNENLGADIEKIETLEFKNETDYNNLFTNSKFTFKKLTFMGDKKVYLENNSYIELSSRSIKIPKGTKVKELVLENMTAVVTDIYHDLISCDDSGLCSYDAEEKRKIQGPDSILGDIVEVYDENNNKIFEWHTYQYEDGEY